MTEFVLDPRLAADSVPVVDLPLCAVRLMRDARHVWLLLVPRQPGLVEIGDLSKHDRGWLMDEIELAGRVLKAETGCLKLNVGALGNLVRQLHVHVVARNEGDATWPGPVWGQGTRTDHAPGELEALAARLGAAIRKG